MLPVGDLRSFHMTTVQEILDAAQALPTGDRAQLITALWDSVTADDWTPPNDAGIKEVQRRSEAYGSGQMTAAPWSDVRERVRREAGLDS
jgi:putative addiction module component (TIGR02574 family)